MANPCLRPFLNLCSARCCFKQAMSVQLPAMQRHYIMIVFVYETTLYLFCSANICIVVRFYFRVKDTIQWALIRLKTYVKIHVLVIVLCSYLVSVSQ